MRRGYIFTLDALFAVLILTTSVYVLYASSSRQQTDYFTDRMASDVISVLSHTRTTDLCQLGPNCNCPNYPALTPIVCDANIQNTDASILELYSEALQGSYPVATNIDNSIHELFIAPEVIESRFGLAILYSAPGQEVYELYNTDTWSP